METDWLKFAVRHLCIARTYCPAPAQYGQAGRMLNCRNHPLALLLPAAIGPTGLINELLSSARICRRVYNQQVEVLPSYTAGVCRDTHKYPFY